MKTPNKIEMALSDGDIYLQPTRLLDFTAAELAALIEKRGWRSLPPRDRIGAAYYFVRDEILFGYNSSDDLPASRGLAEGYGQCNTKATLLMALLRALEIPCRLHGFTIHKSLQKGIVTGLFYALAPRTTLITSLLPETLRPTSKAGEHPGPLSSTALIRSFRK